MTALERNEQIRGVAGGAAVGAALAVLAAFLGDVRAPAGLLLTLIAVGGVAGAFRAARWTLNVGAGALALTLAACLLTPVLRGPLGALTLDQPPVKADAIVALGAGVHCGSRELEASAVARLTGALTLWQAGYAPVVTVSEQSGLIGPRDCPKMSVLETELTRALYGPGGPTLVTLPSVTTTRDEAARVRDLARTRGWTTVLLVTSPSHSRRAAALFRSYGVNVVSVPAQEWRFDQTLGQPSDRLWAVRILVYEGLSRVKAALGGTPER
ncbi:YdcF family protein [Deinococcus depolymerans]|uniref:YdcF family protein n=1 Tax=Deinococcus depolymerans TaxID=392408 RepID=A0ABN1BJE0_9DEIO